MTDVAPSLTEIGVRKLGPTPACAAASTHLEPLDCPLLICRNLRGAVSVQACQFAEGFGCSKSGRLLEEPKSASVVLQFAVPSVTGAICLAHYIFPDGLLLARSTASNSVFDPACCALVLILCVPDRVNYSR